MDGVYPVSVRVGDAYYLINHIKFTVLVHKYEEANMARVMRNDDAVDVILMSPRPGATLGYMVVGFEAVPCSFQHKVDSIKNLKMHDKY